MSQQDDSNEIISTLPPSAIAEHEPRANIKPTIVLVLYGDLDADARRTAHEDGAVISVLKELGHVTAFRRNVHEQSTDICVRVSHATLVVLCAADTPSFWSDLVLFLTRAERDSFVFLTRFPPQEYLAFSQKLSATMQCRLPAFSGGRNRRGALQSALWFRYGIAELQPVTRTDRTISQLVSVPSSEAITKFLLYPVVVQKGFQWKHIPQFSIWRWAVRVGWPLGLVALTLISWIAWHFSLDPRLRLVDQHWRNLQSDIVSGYIAGGHPMATHLDSDQSVQLHELQMKVLMLADEATCAKMANGDSSARNRLLAKLTKEDIDNYFGLVRNTLTQQEQVTRKQVADDLNGAVIIISLALSDSDREHMLRVIDSPSTLSGADGCWFERQLLNPKVDLTESDRNAITRTIGFF